MGIVLARRTFLLLLLCVIIGTFVVSFQAATLELLPKALGFCGLLYNFLQPLKICLLLSHPSDPLLCDLPTSSDDADIGDHGDEENYVHKLNEGDEVLR